MKSDKRTIRVPGKPDTGSSVRQSRRDHRPAGWKRWAFPVAALLLLPAVLLVLVEVTLRAAGVGYPTDFLIPRTIDGKKAYAQNPQYGWRFFPRRVARQPVDTVLSAEKSAGAFRIFVLGESAAMGDPDPAYGIPRMVELMLSSRFPSVDVEVINAAMTGINSHVVRDIARNCAEFQPDCYIVYMGNNEAIGPYGPATVFGSFSQSLSAIRFTMAMQKLKCVQLLAGIAGKKNTEQSEAWGGLRMFMKNVLHPEDRRVAVMGKFLQANLGDICNAGRNAGAHVVVCSVASNLADCAPFASLHNPSLPAKVKAEWDQNWAAAAQMHTGGHNAEALELYNAAEAADPTYAEAVYRKGQIQELLGDPTTAYESYRKSRDLDALRFRATTQFNELTAKAAAAISSDISVLDIEKLVSDDAGTTPPGSAHFVDHVHFNFHGNYIVAREISNAVTPVITKRIKAEPSAPTPTEQECSEQLAFTDWNRFKLTELMLSRTRKPPFNAKSDYGERVAELESAIAGLGDATSSESLRQSAEVYRKAMRIHADDHFLMKGLAEIYTELQEFDEEIKLRKVLSERFPYDPDRKALLAEAYARAGNHAQGEQLAREVLSNDSKHFVARHALAISFEKQGDSAAAVEQYKEVLKLRPDLDAVHHNLTTLQKRDRKMFDAIVTNLDSGAFQTGGELQYRRGRELLNEGQPEQAVDELREAVRLDPSFAEAHLELANALAQLGKADDAIEQYNEAIRVKPDWAAPHNDMGKLLLDLNRIEEARAQFEKAVLLQPGYADAEMNMGIPLILEGRYAEAVDYFKEFLGKYPNHAMGYMKLGTLYEGAAEWEQADKLYRAALRLDPDLHEAQNGLAWVLATATSAPVRNGEEAVRLAESACKANKYSDASALDTLAAAYAEAGRFPQAVEKASEAVIIARTARNESLAADIEKRLALYKANQPYRSGAVTLQPSQ